MQHYDTRVVLGPRAMEAALEFAQVAGEQAGATFLVWGSETSVAIDLEAWPGEESFGSWFTEWATRWGLQVVD
jgi:hypothetical protein